MITTGTDTELFVAVVVLFVGPVAALPPPPLGKKSNIAGFLFRMTIVC